MEYQNPYPKAWDRSFCSVELVPDSPISFANIRISRYDPLSLRINSASRIDDSSIMEESIVSNCLTPVISL